MTNPHTDRIFITGITTTTTIGVYERERHVRQKLIIDLELTCDTRVAGASDRFEDALDYDAITQMTVQLVTSSSFKLIEAVAETLADRLLRKFEVSAVQVTVNKPGALQDADNVGVRIYRER